MARRAREDGARTRGGDEQPLLDYFHAEEETEPGRIGPYELVARFPNTDAIEVFLAHKFSNFGFLRTAVVKRTRRKDPGYAESRQALIDEARAIATLDHANLVSLIDAGEEENGTYLAMEYVDGADLSRVNAKLRARGEALPFELACYIAIEVLRGLHHAHTASSAEGRALDLVHRDVHPSNVLIARTGHVKLTDFGAAFMRERMQEATQPGVMKGRLAYKSPEYLEAGPIDRRMDVYAVGMILFELLTGRPCFSAPNSYELIEKILSRNLRLERLEKEGVPPELVEIVARASNGNVAERYATAEDLANALETWIIKKSLSVSPWILSAFFKQHGLYDPPPIPKQAPLLAAWKHSEPPPKTPEKPDKPERPTAPPPLVSLDVSDEDEEDGPFESPTYPGIPRPLPSTSGLETARDETTSPSIPVAGGLRAALMAPKRPLDQPAPPPRLDIEPLTVPESVQRAPEPVPVGRAPEASLRDDVWPQGRPALRAAALKTGDLVLPALGSRPPAKKPEARAETERPEQPAEAFQRPFLETSEPRPFPPETERARRPFNPAAPTERIRASEASERAARLLEAARAQEAAARGDTPNIPARADGPVPKAPSAPPEVSDLLTPQPRAEHPMPPPSKGPLVVAEVFPDRVEFHAPEAPANLSHVGRAPDTQPEKARPPSEPPDLPALPDVPAVPMTAFHSAQPEPVRFTVEAMTGELGKTTPRDTLEKLIRLGATGRATFTTGPIWKAITLRDGRPLAIASNMGMEILGEQLVHSKLLTRPELDRVLRESTGGDDGLVTRLLKLNLVDKGALARQLGEIVSLRLSDMLDWSEGTFEFAPLVPPEPPLRPDLDMLGMLEASRTSVAPKNKRSPSEEPPPVPSQVGSAKPSLKRVIDMARKVNEASRGRADDLAGSRKK